VDRRGGELGDRGADGTARRRPGRHQRSPRGLGARGGRRCNSSPASPPPLIPGVHRRRSPLTFAFHPDQPIPPPTCCESPVSPVEGMNVMRIGVAPHRLWPLNGDDLEGVLETAVLAERLCFNHVIAGCHLLRTSLGVTPDPIVLLSAVAGATSRIRIATSVMITTLYHPVVLAHQAATLDLLSGGRFGFGVGTGWNRAEFGAVGAEVSRRGKGADESVAMAKARWRGEGCALR